MQSEAVSNINHCNIMKLISIIVSKLNPEKKLNITTERLLKVMGILRHVFSYDIYEIKIRKTTRP